MDKRFSKYIQRQLQAGTKLGSGLEDTRSPHDLVIGRGIRPERLNRAKRLRCHFTSEDGSDIYDYIAAFAGQNDYVMGFHGISSDIIRGESLTGVYFASEVPEPASISLLGLLGGVLFRRRTR